MTSISILIPCFNATEFLKPTLESAIENIENGDNIILVDYHSTHGSLQTANNYLQSTRINLKAVTKPSNGAYSTQNHTFSLLKNPLIQWINANDIRGEEKLKNLRVKLNSNPNSVIVSPFIPFVGDPQNGAIREARNWPSSEIVTGADWLASERMTIPACWLDPRHIFEQAGPWNPQLKVNQDGEYFARVLAQAETSFSNQKSMLGIDAATVNQYLSSSPIKRNHSLQAYIPYLKPH